MRTRGIFIAILAALLALCFTAAFAGETESPNIVMILEEDRAAGSVTVSYRVQGDATLALEVFEDTGSGLTSVNTLRQPVSSATYPSYETYTFHLSLPEYFQLEARLEDLPAGQSAEPFVSERNTREIRDYMDRTIHDWPGHEVLNLDGDASTNYIVLQEGVRLIQEQDGLTVSVSDDETGSFVLKGSSEKLSALGLQAGDKCVVAQTGSGSLLCVQIKSVSASSGMLAVDAEKLSLDKGLFTYRITGKGDHTFNVDEAYRVLDPLQQSVDASVSMKGSIIVAAEADGILCLTSLKKNYITFTVEVIVPEMVTDSTGTYQHTFNLGETVIFGVPGLGGVTLFVNLPLQAVDTKINFDYSYRIFSVLTLRPSLEELVQGAVNIEQPAFSLNELSGELDVGVQCALGLSVLEKFVQISAGAVHFLCMEGKISGGELSGGVNKDDFWHPCVSVENGVQLPKCFSGTAGYMYSWSAGFNILNLIDKSITVDIITAFRHYFPWYYSLQFHEGGFNKKCPEVGVRTSVTVIDQDGNPLSGASVSSDTFVGYELRSTGVTDANGKTVLYLPKGGDKEEDQNIFKVSATWQHPTLGIMKGDARAIVGSSPISVTIIIPIKSTTVRFADESGGAPATNMPPDALVTPVQDYYTIPDTIPEKPGMTFLGWSDRPDDWTARFLPGDRIGLDFDKEYNMLYAIWERITYTVRYDPSGGTGGPPDGIKYATEPYIISDTQPQKDGCVFLGWSTLSEYDDPDYFPGQVYDVDADLTLRAVWLSSPVPPCRLTYDANADSTAIAPQPQYAPAGSVILLRTEEPEWDGLHTFLGWSTEAEPADGMPSLYPGDEYMLFGDTTLYAIWQTHPVSACKVTYDANADSTATAPQPQYAAAGSVIRLRTEEPVWDEAHLFLGWSTVPDPADGLPSLMPGEAYTVSSDVTLYAVWQLVPVTACKITYDVNGGDPASAPVNQFALPGATVRLRSGEPVWDALHTFLGWSTEAEPADGMPSLFPGQEYTVTDNVTLYAVWMASPTVVYRVSYDANADDSAAAAPLTQYATMGSTIRLHKSGATWDDAHTFLGWNTDPAPADGMPTLFPGQEYTVTGDVTLYAIWQDRPVLVYEVTYDPAPGTGGPKTQTQAEGRTLTLSSTLPVFEGHLLAGWRSSRDGYLWKPGGLYNLGVTTHMTAEWKPDYRILQGDGAVVQLNSGNTLLLKANGPLDLFDTLMIDGKALRAAGNYDLHSGSTVCVLKADYLNSLAAGEHTFRFVYQDGQTETGRFTVQGTPVPPPTGDPGVPLLPGLLALIGLCFCVPALRKKA